MKIQDIIETPKNPNEFDEKQVEGLRQRYKVDPNLLKTVAQDLFRRRGGGGNPEYPNINLVLDDAAKMIAQGQAQKQQQQQQQPQQPAPATTPSKPAAARTAPTKSAAQATQQARQAKSAIGRAWQKGVQIADKYVGVARKSR